MYYIYTVHALVYSEKKIEGKVGRYVAYYIHLWHRTCMQVCTSIYTRTYRLQYINANAT